VNVRCQIIITQAQCTAGGTLLDLICGGAGLVHSFNMTDACPTFGQGAHSPVLCSQLLRTNLASLLSFFALVFYFPHFYSIVDHGTHCHVNQRKPVNDILTSEHVMQLYRCCLLDAS
jgi:hypothetical protein